jgi:hypothetical protein
MLTARNLWSAGTFTILGTIVTALGAVYDKVPYFPIEFSKLGYHPAGYYIFAVGMSCAALFLGTAHYVYEHDRVAMCGAAMLAGLAIVNGEEPQSLRIAHAVIATVCFLCYIEVFYRRGVPMWSVTWPLSVIIIGHAFVLVYAMYNNFITVRELKAVVKEALFIAASSTAIVIATGAVKSFMSGKPDRATAVLIVVPSLALLVLSIRDILPLLKHMATQWFTASAAMPVSLHRTKTIAGQYAMIAWFLWAVGRTALRR